MIPTVTQQLRALRTRLAETVLPALPAEAGFAREQALLMAATLDWLVDTHEHEYRYQVVENHEYRELVAALEPDAADAADTADTAALLARPAPAPEDVAVPLAEIAEQNRQLKDRVDAAYARAAADPEQAAGARTLLSRVARHQRDRELAWYRMTGFPGAVDRVDAVLDERAGAAAVPESRRSTEMDSHSTAL